MYGVFVLRSRPISLTKYRVDFIPTHWVLVWFN